MFSSCLLGFYTDLYESDGSFSSYVDVYDVTSSNWIRYPQGLTQARGFLAAASLPSGLVFFAGGLAGVAWCQRAGKHSNCFGSCEQFEFLLYFGALLPANCNNMHVYCICNDSCASGNIYSGNIDLYNATSNSWTRHPKGLGQARGYLAATSLPSGLVFFAGGWSQGRIFIVLAWGQQGAFLCW